MVKNNMKVGQFHMEKLAIFDIDYTLTKKETSIELYKYMLKKDRKLLRYLPSHIITGIFYGLKVYNAGRTKENFLRFLAGTSEEDLKKLVKRFYKEKIESILIKDNIEVDFKNSYMFSDSLSDLPLLKLVGKGYLINYKKNHELEILRWR